MLFSLIMGNVAPQVSRLYVEKSIFDKVVAGVADQAKQIKIGPGLDLTTQMGPLVSNEQQHRFWDIWSRDLPKEKRLRWERSRIKGYFVEPTVWLSQMNYEGYSRRNFGSRGLRGTL